MSTSNFFEFNTGRQYTPSGQIIQCKSTPDGVYFYDVSRMIVGFIPDCVNSEGAVLRHYDHGRYIALTFSDGNIRDIMQHFKGK